AVTGPSLRATPSLHDALPIWLEARRSRQLRIEQRRTQIAEQTQLGADLQQAAFGADGRIDGVPLGATHCAEQDGVGLARALQGLDRKSTRLNSSHVKISYAVF